MKKKLQIVLFSLAMLICLPVSAQIKIKGVLNNNRYDDGDQLKSIWIGSLYDNEGNYTGVTSYIVDYGIYAMTWDGNTLSTPTKEPEVNISDIKQGSQVDYDKAVWANNFINMYGNSGSIYVDGKLVTITSRDYQSTEDEELFRVCKWDAKTGNMLSNEIFPVSANIESAGICFT